jgi:hypothetical protein
VIAEKFGELSIFPLLDRRIRQDYEGPENNNDRFQRAWGLAHYRCNHVISLEEAGLLKCSPTVNSM